MEKNNDILNIKWKKIIMNIFKVNVFIHCFDFQKHISMTDKRFITNKNDPNAESILLGMILYTLLSSQNDAESKGASTFELANCTHTLLCTNCRWSFEYFDVCHCSLTTTYDGISILYLEMRVAY